MAVKCDSPPFGSMVKGRNVGVDVDIAQQLALLAFGNKNARHLHVRNHAGTRGGTHLR